MPLTESLKAQALRELMSESCACGGLKKKGRSFCPRCYFALPAEKRSLLYTTFSDGYAELYDEAKDWLRENTERLMRKGA